MALTKIKTNGLADNSVTDAKVADAITVTGAQTGITSVGTLTGLTVSGDVNFDSNTLFVDASENKVGIGETSMDALLVIKGNSDAHTTPSIRLKDGSDTRETWISNTAGDLVLANGGNDNVPHCMIKMFDGNIMQFSTSGLERARITPAGDVMLGNQTMTDHQYQTLGIRGDASDGVSSVTLLTANASNTSGRNWGIASNYSAHGNLDFRYSSDKDATPFANLAMTIHSDGNVSIGSSGNGDRLYITDGATPYSGADRMLQLKRNATNGNNTTSFCSMMFGNNSNAFTIGYGGTTDRFRFIDGGGNEQMSITNGGEIAFQSVYGRTVGATNRDLYIGDGGDLGYVSSVREHKMDIKSLSDVTWLSDLNPVSFYRRNIKQDGTYGKTKDGSIEYGLIADEVEKVNKDFVFYDIDEDENKVLAGVEYRQLIIPMLKKIQELSSKVTALEKN